jgi:hypothetical protein
MLAILRRFDEASARMPPAPIASVARERARERLKQAEAPPEIQCEHGPLMPAGAVVLVASLEELLAHPTTVRPRSSGLDVEDAGLAALKAKSVVSETDADADGNSGIETCKVHDEFLDEVKIKREAEVDKQTELHTVAQRRSVGECDDDAIFCGIDDGDSDGEIGERWMDPSAPSSAH